MMAVAIHTSEQGQSTLRNYSMKRTLKEQENPPEKRQRVEKAASQGLRSTLKRTIEDYFQSAVRPISHSSLSFSEPPSCASRNSLEGPSPKPKQGKKRRLITYTHLSKFGKMYNEEFHVGSPRPIPFLRDLSPSPVSAEGSTGPQIVDKRRKGRGRLLAHRTPTVLADCHDLLADVVEWISDSSSSSRSSTVVNHETRESQPGAIEISPPHNIFLESQRQAVANNQLETYHARNTSTLNATRPSLPDILFESERQAVASSQLEPSHQTTHHARSVDVFPSSSRNIVLESQSQAIASQLEPDHHTTYHVRNVSNTLRPQPSIAMQPIAQNSGNLVQTQISLGGNTNVTCQICHLSYNSTLTADKDLHDEYHQNIDKGLSTNGLKPCDGSNVKKLLSHINPDGEENFVISVHRKSSQSWKNLAITALTGNVDRDLGAQAISEEELWSLISLPASEPCPIVTQGSKLLPELPVDRFKVYMYLKSFGRGKPCRVIAVLLAERITEGFESYIDGSGNSPSRNPLRFEYTFGRSSGESHAAVLGINKIWVHKRYRRRGLASTLVDVARKDFIFGHRISRLEIAWTHPTEEGAKFAMRCLKGKAAYDFLSYTDRR